MEVLNQNKRPDFNEIAMYCDKAAPHKYTLSNCCFQLLHFPTIFLHSPKPLVDFNDNLSYLVTFVKNTMINN